MFKSALSNSILYCILFVISFEVLLTLQENNDLQEYDFLANILLVDNETALINERNENTFTDPGAPFVKIGNKFYIIQQGRKVSWFEAFYLCTTYGAELANIENEAEMKAISDYLLSLTIKDTDWFWLSGNTLMGPEGVFSSANTQKGMSYTNWLPAQPDKAGGVEYCVHLWPQTKAKTIGMNDWTCGGKAHFLCVHPRAQVKNDATRVVAIPAVPPKQRNHIKIGAKYYLVMDKRVATYSKAKSLCNSHDAILAKIQNDFEMVAISNYLMKPDFNNKQFWISGSDQYREGAFMWTMDYDQQRNIEVSYAKWSTNMPDNFLAVQHCMVLWKRIALGGWVMDDDYCEKPFNFICEFQTSGPRYKLEMK